MPNQEAVTVATKLVGNMFCRLSDPDQLHSNIAAQSGAQLMIQATMVREQTSTGRMLAQGMSCIQYYPTRFHSVYHILFSVWEASQDTTGCNGWAGESETCCQYASKSSIESAYRIARQNPLVCGRRQKEHYGTG